MPGALRHRLARRGAARRARAPSGAHCQINTFGGGVNEVQREIVAMMGLGLRARPLGSGRRSAATDEELRASSRRLESGPRAARPASRATR